MTGQRARLFGIGVFLQTVVFDDAFVREFKREWPALNRPLLWNSPLFMRVFVSRHGVAVRFFAMLMRRGRVLLRFLFVPVLMMVRRFVMVMLGGGMMRSSIQMMLCGRMLSL